MPYRRAWLGVALLFILSIPAFSRNYLQFFSVAEWQIHFHAATAGLWVLLVVFQSRSIHRGHRGLHRAAGLTSLILAPLFIASAFLVIATMAVRPIPFYDLFAARLGLIDVVAAFAFAFFMFMALRDRRSVGLHGGWMLATVFLMITPTLARLFPAFVPGLTIRSAEEMVRFAGSVQLAQFVGICIAVFLLFRYRSHNAPMKILLGVLLLQSILFETLGKSAWWDGINSQIGAMPPGVLMAFGVALGAIAVAAGWTSGSRRTVEPQVVA